MNEKLKARVFSVLWSLTDDRRRRRRRRPTAEAQDLFSIYFRSFVVA